RRAHPREPDSRALRETAPAAGDLVARRGHVLLLGARVVQRAPLLAVARLQRRLAGQRRDAALDPANRDGRGRGHPAGGDAGRLRPADPASRDRNRKRRAQGDRVMDALITALLIVLLFVLLGSGLWIGLSLLGVAWIGMELFTSRPVGDAMAVTIWGSLSSWALTALPLFVWLGE